MQWGFTGNVYIPDIDCYEFNISFPIPFPNKVITIQTTINEADTVRDYYGSGLNDSLSSVNEVTNSSAKLLIGSTVTRSDTLGIYWFALGY